MSWIETIPYADSDGKLRKLYDRVKGPGNNVDNVMMMHSLRRCHVKQSESETGQISTLQLADFVRLTTRRMRAQTLNVTEPCCISSVGQHFATTGVS